MNIPTIYILFTAEVLFILLGLIAFLFFYIRKLSNTPTLVEATNQENSIDISNSYIEYLEQEIERNNSKSAQVETDEMETDTSIEESDDNNEEEEDENENKDEDNTLDNQQINKQSQLLEARNILLNTEKKAAEQSEDEQAFWDAIYSGMQTIAEQFKIIEEIPAPEEELKEELIEETKETKETKETEETEEADRSDEEKVLYIETQGKKIDQEVNKLKDIIYEQENTVNGLKKALENTEINLPEGSSLDDNEHFQDLKQQADAFERQISDSKMCMEVLEMENDRLQTEVDDLQGRYDELFKKQAEAEAEPEPAAPETTTPAEPESNENIDQIKEALDKQEQQIMELNSTIDGLQLEASEAATLKDKLSEFARNSQEMMGCIAILEDENAFLQNMVTDLEAKGDTPSSPEEPGDTDNSSRMQEELEKQEAQIAELNKTIDDLQLTAEQAEKLKSTIGEFTRSSQEMMSCITILEEENESLQNIITDMENQQPEEAASITEAAPSATDEQFDKLKTKVKKYEKEIIKKDVAYAKLQDELSTIEKEMQALYERSGDS